MKKVVFLAMLLVFFVASSGVSFSAEGSEAKDSSKGSKKHGMMGELTHIKCYRN